MRSDILALMRMTERTSLDVSKLAMPVIEVPPHHTVELYIVELQTVLANDREQAILGRAPVAEPAPIPRGQHAQQRPPSGSKTSHRLPPMGRTSTHRRPSGATRGACFVVPGGTARVRGPKPSSARLRHCGYARPRPIVSPLVAKVPVLSTCSPQVAATTKMAITGASGTALLSVACAPSGDEPSRRWRRNSNPTPATAPTLGAKPPTDAPEQQTCDNARPGHAQLPGRNNIESASPATTNNYAAPQAAPCDQRVHNHHGNSVVGSRWEDMSWPSAPNMVSLLFLLSRTSSLSPCHRLPEPLGDADRTTPTLAYPSFCT